MVFFTPDEAVLNTYFLYILYHSKKYYISVALLYPAAVIQFFK